MRPFFVNGENRLLNKPLEISFVKKYNDYREACTKEKVSNPRQFERSREPEPVRELIINNFSRVCLDISTSLDVTVAKGFTALCYSKWCLIYIQSRTKYNLVRRSR